MLLIFDVLTTMITMYIVTIREICVKMGQVSEHGVDGFLQIIHLAVPQWFCGKFQG